MTAELSKRLELARQLAARGQDESATAEYLALLRLDPTHFDALNEVGTLALATGHRSAAQTAYRQAVQCHPDNPTAQVNLGHLLLQDGEFAAARLHYEAALSTAPDLAEAHQGLARALTQLGEPVAAEPHFQKGFSGHAIVEERYRGTASPVRVLLLVSIKLGNISIRQILTDRVFRISALYAEFYDPAQPLPPHSVVFNAIGDADLCAHALERAEDLVAQTAAPVINAPDRVLRSGRAENARRLASLPGVIAPAIRSIARTAPRLEESLKFPLLLRVPGFHTGKHFLRIERHEDLAAAMAELPGDELLTIEYLDARGGDGMARKYRVMIIDGVLYPLHLAISSDWKVHYFSADMATNESHREEEGRFLRDMAGVLGSRTMSALAGIDECLGLDYAGIDFGLAPDGSVLLFEANANMSIIPPAADRIWDYRREAIGCALDAAQRMVLRRSGAAESPT